MVQREIKEQAIQFAYKNKAAIAKELTNPETFPPAEIPISVFMAGSPGAGKTEYSEELVKSYAPVIRIDSDNLRSCFPNYTGNNSSLFQGATSILVDRILDKVLKQKQNFILDGTFSHLPIAEKNIQRSLEKGRRNIVFYVYQHPEIAWKFTQAREKKDGRRIYKKDFIYQYFSSRLTVETICQKYEAEVYLVEKDIQPHTIKRIYQLRPGESIDLYIPNNYTVSALRNIL